MTPEEILIGMRQLFEKVPKEIKPLSQELSVWDRKVDECNHYIENHPKMSAQERIKILDTTNKARRGRREVKYDMQIIQSLRDNIVDKYNQKFILKDIDIALQKLKELRNQQENPTYTYQYLTKDLEFIEGDEIKDNKDTVTM